MVASVRSVTALVFAPFAFTLAAPIPVTNPSFELPATPAGTFITNAPPLSWAAYGANLDFGGRTIGVLNPNATVLYADPVPDGSNVGVTFLLPSFGSEAGLQQTLAATLEPLTAYTLTVEVGNLAYDGGPYAFTGFPGYRIDLLAGPTVLASDDDTLLPGEGRFRTSTVQFTTGISHPNTGEALGIRLVNLDAAAGIEVNFDDVRLDATAVSPCPVSPPVSCKTAAPGTGSLAINRKLSNPAKSRLTWKWKGQATSLPELADPTTTAGYRFCLYDGGINVVLDLGLAAAGTCGTRPCWKASSTGFSYKDAAGAAGGVTAFTAKAGSDDNAALKLKAKGANLTPPTLPLSQSPAPVRLLVTNEASGTCWIAAYSTPPADPTSLERWRSKND